MKSDENKAKGRDRLYGEKYLGNGSRGSCGALAPRKDVPHSVLGVPSQTGAWGPVGFPVAPAVPGGGFRDGAQQVVMVVTCHLISSELQSRGLSSLVSLMLLTLERPFMKNQANP